MSQSVIRELKRLRALERGRIDSAAAGFTVALLYPNLYHVGMSNLGFQLVYGLLNSLPDVRAERGFLIPNSQTYTLESLKGLRQFDCVAFSLSCEQDYGNCIEMLRRSSFPLLSRERDERHPLVMGGGVCVSLNPEPLADIFDLFVLGEAEAVLGRLVARFVEEAGRGRDGLLRAAAEIPGVYVPRFFEPVYGTGGRLRGFDALEPGIPAPARQHVRDLDRWPACAPVVSPRTEFGDRVMVEAGRGCGRQCRFCVAEYAYRPPRARSRAALLAAVEEGISRARGVALLGPSLTDHPDIEEAAEAVAARGRRISVSSVRADRVSPRLLEALVRGGLRKLTIAPETPVARLQRKLNKAIPPADVISVAEAGARAGLKELKLYYLMAIEGEEESDLLAIAEEVRAIAAVLPVRVSVAPLIPKARTPLQWEGMAPEGELRRRYGLLRKRMAVIPRVLVSEQSIREAAAEATLARGDRTLARHLIGGRLPRDARMRFALRRRDEDEIFPWDHLDCGVSAAYLRAESKKYRSGELTAACVPGTCRLCGSCG